MGLECAIRPKSQLQTVFFSETGGQKVSEKKNSEYLFAITFLVKMDDFKRKSAQK